MHRLAHTALRDREELTEHHLERLRARYEELARRGRGGGTQDDSGTIPHLHWARWLADGTQRSGGVSEFDWSQGPSARGERQP